MQKSTDQAIETVRRGYAFAGPALDLGSLVVDGVTRPEISIRVPLSMLSRHGLVAGATGTGKTKTLQLKAEQLSAHGVPVFLADIKGDLSGLAGQGRASDEVVARAREVGQDWRPAACPVEFYTLGGGGAGIPVRATIKSFGPTLLSKVLGLGQVQESSLGLVFHFADKSGLPLRDLNDLRAVIQYLTDEGTAELKALGGLSAATAGVILRQLITLGDQGGDEFFGEPGFDTADLLRTTEDGRGVVSCLELAEVQDRPRLFSTFLMWLLADLFHRLPEVGDADKPRLVFFLDEAHLLFQEASKAFLAAVEQTVRLIRSKGVGVFFVTQSPRDVPSQVLAQLGSRVQHALRAFTAEDVRALKATVSTFPRSGYDLEKLLTELGIGEAVVSVLSDRGIPTPVAWTRLRVPQSRMAPVEATVIEEAARASPLAAKYAVAVERGSAVETLATPPKANTPSQGSAQGAAQGSALGPMPKRSLSPARGGNLPALVTSFVGRRHELAEVRKLLSSSRLVTLTGVGGVGKTRLALRVAQELQRAFPDGVWLVDVSGLDDPGLLPHTVATSLGMRNQSGRSPTAALADYLGDRQLLLVLDNCEHVLDACAVLADELLRRAPGLRILATSRQPLSISGEHIFAVSPLPAPDPQQPPPPEALDRYEAVRLFLERARAVAPDFTITAGNHVDVAKLCHRLDGLPLALELAAGRIRILAPEQILARLSDRYRLLTAGSRAAHPRQQSLRALIDWSFDTCTPQEQTLWSRLAVFPGDFDLDAAEEICCGDGLPRESILDALAGLADKSILTSEDHPRQVRYRLLESIREYGRERLASAGAQDALQRRHRDYYRRLTDAAEADWFSPQQLEWMARLHTEHTNLRAALARCLRAPETAPAGLAMAAALGMHWIGMGSPGEGRRWLERGLTLVTGARPERAKALWVTGRMALHQRDIAAAEAMLSESRALGQRLGDHHIVANATMYLGQVAMMRGELEAASRLFEEALDRHRHNGDDSCTALILARLSMAASLSGYEDRADACYRESLAISEANGELWCRAFALWNHSLAIWQRGDTQQAIELARQSLRIKLQFDDRVGIAQCLDVLAWMATTAGQHERAARLLGAVNRLWRDIGASLYEHLAHHHDECEAKTRKALGSAFDRALQHGAKLPLDEAVAYALGQQPAPHATTTHDTAPTLTRREREIAQLVADGLSNKDIAAKLVISRRTAEAHVEHILTKLGFTSRTQIAAWLAEERATTRHS